MSYDQALVDRVGQYLDERSVAHYTKKMFGGVCFMVDDKMLVGITKERLMVRLDPEDYETSLTRRGVVPMDFTKRTMRGFVFVLPEGLDMESDFAHWMDAALQYNPRAKSSRKKKKK